MHRKIIHPPVAFNQYRPLISSQLADELTLLASQLGHLRFVHINSTATGGGVAEILQSMVPLMNSLGITTERVVIEPPPEFFQVTKRIHNLLQGAKGSLSSDELDVYYQSIEDVAKEIRRDHLKADVWFLHDPQLLPLAHLLPRDNHTPWLWVVHIDLTSPNQQVLKSLLPLTYDYDQLVFSMESYVPKELNGAASVYIAP
ncbi:MAG: glycosyl transferase family 1, partial [Planctomycetes bacterium]|nr:glycosyl transferase family 1 [Planctomycetota bacterium]